MAAQAASDGKAENIVILDVADLSSVTDFFVIFTGASTTHLRALARRIEESLENSGIRVSRVDGAKSTGWIVLDYGNVVAHGMLEGPRRHYDIERLWGDAPRTEWPQ